MGKIIPISIGTNFPGSPMRWVLLHMKELRIQELYYKLVNYI